MRNMAIVTLRRVGFPGWRVAEVFGLTPTYVARLKTAAARDSAAALAGQDGPGRPRALGEDKQELARQWREQGESDLEIGRRLGVAGTTVARRLAARPASPAAAADAVPGQEELEFAEPGRNLAGTWNWLRNPGRSPGRGQIQGRSRSKEEQEPGRVAGLAAEPGPGGRPARRGRGRLRSAAAGAGRAEDHRRGVLVAVCGGDAAARVHGPGRGGAGAGVRRRGRAGRPVPAVRRCGAAVGDQHVLRAGG